MFCSDARLVVVLKYNLQLHSYKDLVKFYL